MVHRKYMEKGFESGLFIASAVTVFALFLICFFLFRDGYLLFETFPFIEFITGTGWYPTSAPPEFGLLPLLFGSLLVTAGAIIIAVPLGSGNCDLYCGTCQSECSRVPETVY